jgi:hypothetical protein
MIFQRRYYTLDEHQAPVPCDDFARWAVWFETHTAERLVAKTELPGDVTVSTVFIGTNLGVEEQPRIFETMIFGGHQAHYTARYASWFEAEQGHERAVDLACARANLRGWIEKQKFAWIRGIEKDFSDEEPK